MRSGPDGELPAGVGLFLATEAVWVSVNWSLLLEESWCADGERRVRARIPASVTARPAWRHILDFAADVAANPSLSGIPWALDLRRTGEAGAAGPSPAGSNGRPSTAVRCGCPEGWENRPAGHASTVPWPGPGDVGRAGPGCAGQVAERSRPPTDIRRRAFSSASSPSAPARMASRRPG
ncbi:transposase [Streptomyces eurythermus]